MGNTYNCIEEGALDTFCFEPSGSSRQPDKPTIINVMARRDNTFFIMFLLYEFIFFILYLGTKRALSTGNLYHG